MKINLHEILNGSKNNSSGLSSSLQLFPLQCIVSAPNKLKFCSSSLIKRGNLFGVLITREKDINERNDRSSAELQ